MKNIFTATALLAIGLAVPATSQARVSIAIDLGGHHGRFYAEAYQRGVDRGYRDGEHLGFEDARLRLDFDLGRHHEFRAAERDCRSGLESRRGYAFGFRDGFERGYRDAFFRGHREFRHHDRWEDRDWRRSESEHHDY